MFKSLFYKKYLIAELIKQNLCHLLPPLRTQMHLQRQYNGPMILMLIGEIRNSRNHIHKQNTGRGRKPMLHNKLTAPLMHINLHTLNPPIQILNISLNLGVRSKLIARQIGIVGAEAVVAVEGVVHVLIDFALVRVEDAVLVGEDVAAERVHADFVLAEVEACALEELLDLGLLLEEEEEFGELLAVEKRLQDDAFGFGVDIRDFLVCEEVV